jgi:hypothetical protein
MHDIREHESGTGHDRAPEPAGAGLRGLVRANIATVAFEVLLPMAVFYGLRALGVDQWWALMAGIVVAVPPVVVGIVRRRRLDLTAAFTLSIMLFSVVIGLLTDDPRALVVREGWIGLLLGLLGAWILVTVVVGRPALMVLGNSIATAKAGPEGARKWAGRYDAEPRFRHAIRVLSVVWGTALVLDTAVHVALVYLLPIDLVAIVSNVQWWVVLAALLSFHVWYIRKEQIGA